MVKIRVPLGLLGLYMTLEMVDPVDDVPKLEPGSRTASLEIQIYIYELQTGKKAI